MKEIFQNAENRIIKPGDSGLDIIRKTMFRLLPIQVLFAAVGSVNGIDINALINIILGK